MKLLLALALAFIYAASVYRANDSRAGRILAAGMVVGLFTIGAL